MLAVQATVPVKYVFVRLPSVKSGWDNQLAARVTGMENTRVHRKLRWCPAGALLVLVLAGNLDSLAQQPGTKPDVYYYRRVAIDTRASHTDPDNKKWADEHWSVSNSGNEIKILDGKGLNYPGSVWQVQPDAGKGSYRQVNNGKQEGTLEVTWTVPPEYLSSDRDLSLSISTVADGNVWGGAGFWDAPAERFEPGSEKSVVGKNPFAGVPAGKWSGGFVPKEQGSITVRPKGNAGTFMLLVFLDVSYDFAVHYHYEQLPPGEVPPKQPPGKGNNPPQTGCEKTFAKEWNSEWGKWSFHIDGNKANGTYENRKGKFGPGTVTGTVSGNVIDGTWKDAHGDGTIHLVLSDDGCHVSGTHTTNPPGNTGNGTGPNLTDPGAQDPGTGPGPTGPGPTDPGSDPAAQGCIDQWIKLAMSILNRRDKTNSAPNGPWRVSEYGQLVGHGIKSAGPPDGWETTYHRNRYAYIWANWQQTHTLPSYGGELPALKSFVEDCQSKQGGGATPTGPGATGYPPNTNPGTPMTLLAENRKVLAGDNVLVPVWLVNGADVANINFTVGYDGNVAKPEGDPGKGNLLGEALFSANPKEAGLIRLGFAQSKGLSGTGTVAYLPFRAVGKPGDRTPLHLEVQIINNPGGTALTIAKIDGSITIVGPDGLVPGDCDGDGELTAADAKCALDMSVKLIPEKANMDMDGDGQVTSRDATIILQRRAMFLAKGGK